jgi:hypothetical protein
MPIGTVSHETGHAFGLPTSTTPTRPRAPRESASGTDGQATSPGLQRRQATKRGRWWSRAG